MKKIFILFSIFNIFLLQAQDKVVTKNGKEVEVNKDASATEKGIVKLAGDLGGTADAPTVPGLANKQNSLTLTTTGTGAATLTGATLNIPTPTFGTPWFTAGSTTDAGGDKTNAIYRNGSTLIATGTTTQTTPLKSFHLQAGGASNLTSAFGSGQIFSTNDVSGARFFLEHTTSNINEKTSVIYNQSGLTYFGAILSDNGGSWIQPAPLVVKHSNGFVGFNQINPSHQADINGNTRITGNVGIGSASSSSSPKLVVNDITYISNLPITSANLMDNSTFRPLARFQTTLGVNNNAISHYLTTTAAATQAHNYSTGASLPYVLQPAGGNVGIGTTNPTTNLDVVGGMSLRNAVGAAGSNFGIEFNTNASSPRIDWVYNGAYTGSFVGDADNFFRLQNSRLGSGGFRFMTNPSGTAVERFTILHNGNIGISNTNPTQRLTITGTNNQPASSGSTSNATVRIDGSSNHALDIGAYANSPFGSYVQSVDKSNLATALPLNLNPVAGNVGIGTSNPISRLEVNGAATNTTAFNAAAGTSIDFSRSNLAYTTASAGAFTLTNVKDGGTYTLAVQGTTSGTATFTASGFTVRTVNNGPTTAGRQTLYTFIVMGTTVYVYMATGFN